MKRRCPLESPVALLHVATLLLIDCIRCTAAMGASNGVGIQIVSPPHRSTVYNPTNSVEYPLNSRHLINSSTTLPFDSGHPILSVLLSNGIQKTQLMEQLLDLPHRNRSLLYDGSTPRATLFTPTASRFVILDAELPPLTLSRHAIINQNEVHNTIKDRRLSFKLLECIANHSTVIVIPIIADELIVNNEGNVVLPINMQSTIRQLSYMHEEQRQQHSAAIQKLQIVATLQNDGSHTVPDSVLKAAIESNLFHPSSVSSTVNVSVVTIHDKDSLLSAKRYINRIVNTRRSLYNISTLINEIKQEDDTPQYLLKNEILDNEACKGVMRLIMNNVEVVFDEWNKYLKRDVVIKNFGKTAEQLYKQWTAEYDMKTSTAVNSAERYKYKRMMKSQIETRLRSIIFRQLLLLERRGRLKLRADLLSITNIGHLPDEGMKQSVVERATKTFADTVEELHISVPPFDEVLRSIFNAMCKTYENSLKSYAEKFDTLPIAQLKSEGKLQTADDIRQALRRKGEKKQRGIRMGFGLTAMLRQDGLGNLQGFTNYENGPFLLTLGYANDRNSPDALQNGKKPPYFRIQPKFHFDVNL